MGFLPLVEACRSPVGGFVTLGLLLFVLFAKGRLPVRLPGVLVAFLFGPALYYGLVLSGLGAPGFALPRAAALHVAISLPSLAFVKCLPSTVPYLPLLLPFGLLMVVGGITVSELPRAAGADSRPRHTP